jgi:hypothetical protein
MSMSTQRPEFGHVKKEVVMRNIRIGMRMVVDGPAPRGYGEMHFPAFLNH